MALNPVIVNEFRFATSRSGGKGGQHVNKTESRVEMQFHIPSSGFLTYEEKQLLLHKLTGKIDSEGYLRLYESSTRSQHTNKEKLIKKALAILEASLRKPKKRKPTKVSAAAKAKRLKSKQKRSDVKKLRRRSSFDQ
jgi:ribosome-associated protein